MAVDPIIADLYYVMETGQELDILNFHKSFPITCKGRVESIRQNQVVLKVQPPGSVCLEAQDTTILLSRGLPEAVRAKIGTFDLVSGMLILVDFGFVGSHFGERMIARVQPGDPIEVGITCGDKSCNGVLADVSLSGIGVFVKESDFRKGQDLELALPLPEGNVRLEGKVLNVTETPEGQIRLAIGFTKHAQEIAVVMRYIKDRRTEILAEVEFMYEQSYNKKLSEKQGSEG